jgi:hypothetical protein
MENTKVQELIEQIDEYAERMSEYALSDESCHAEFCQSFGYGDDVPRLDDLEPHVRELVAKLKDESTKGTFLSALGDCCELVQTGIYIQTNEVYSVGLGEIEEQLPDEISESLKTLSDEEYALVRRGVNHCYMPERARSYSDCIYLNHSYDRFVLVLDEEKLADAVTDLQSA